MRHDCSIYESIDDFESRNHSKLELELWERSNQYPNVSDLYVSEQRNVERNLNGNQQPRLLRHDNHTIHQLPLAPGCDVGTQCVPWSSLGVYRSNYGNQWNGGPMVLGLREWSYRNPRCYQPHLSKPRHLSGSIDCDFGQRLCRYGLWQHHGSPLASA